MTIGSEIKMKIKIKRPRSGRLVLNLHLPSCRAE